MYGFTLSSATISFVYQIYDTKWIKKLKTVVHDYLCLSEGEYGSLFPRENMGDIFPRALILPIYLCLHRNALKLGYDHLYTPLDIV